MNIDTRSTKTACVTLEDVLVAASIRASALAPETSGYLTLALADATNRLPLGVEPRAVLLTTEGTVTLARRGPVLAPEIAAASVREVLAKLLEVSAGSMPGLAHAARARSESDRGVDAVASDIEGALIPVNRSAGRRALARLARETARAREMGKISAALKKAAGDAPKKAPRDLATTLVGVEPAPAPVSAPVAVTKSASLPSRPPMSAPSSPDFDANECDRSAPAGVVVGYAERVASAAAEPIETPAPAEISIPIDVIHEPFEATPTSLGMSLLVEESPVIVPSPSHRPTATETAPWGALDDAAIAKLDLAALDALIAEPILAPEPTFAEPARAEAVAAPSEPPPPSSESPVVSLFVEEAPAAERITLLGPAPDRIAPQAALVVVEPSASIEPASIAIEAAPAAPLPSEPVLAEAPLEVSVELVSEPVAPTLSDPPALPYVFELLRRAASPSAAPPPPSDRTRTDDLLERFGGGATGDAEALRAAASSLKTLIGLSPTPPPIGGFAPVVASPHIVLTDVAAPAATLAVPVAPPAPVVAFAPRSFQRRVNFASPMLFFALGVLAAGAAVSALRPDIVSDFAARLGRGAPRAQVTAIAPAAPPPAPSAAATDSPRRGPARAEREPQTSTRPRAAD